MNLRATELAELLRRFNEDVVGFVEKCTEEDWQKKCDWEDWTVGVTARHIGAGHYGTRGMAAMILKGEKLPELSHDQIIEMANQHAREHADCSRKEVLGLLREEGDALVEFVSGLDDDGLDRKGYLAMVGKEISVAQFLETVVLQSGGDHLSHMKTAVGA